MSVSQNKRTYISLIEDPENHEEVLMFIEQKYKKVFGTIPGAPQKVCVARRGDQIVGTLGFEYCDKEGKLPAQKIYDLDCAVVPFPIDGHRTIQFGRWVSEVPNVSEALIYGVTTFALSQGKEFGWSEQKVKAQKACARIGIILHKVENANLKLENIASVDKKYYTTSPRPQLYMSHLQQMQEAVKKRMQQIYQPEELLVAVRF